MTPLPRPTPTLRRMRADNPIPMKSTEYLRWRNKPKPAPISLPTDAEIEAGLARIQGRPYPGDTIEAVPGEPPADEMDAGFYGALRLSSMVVGAQEGRVPWPVANRLYDAGLIRKQE